MGTSLPPANPSLLCPQLYELDADPKRKEFLDDLFSFMQKRGERLPGQKGLMGGTSQSPVCECSPDSVTVPSSTSRPQVDQGQTPYPGPNSLSLGGGGAGWVWIITIPLF